MKDRSEGPQGKAVGSILKGLRVLVVEDEYLVAREEADLLEEFGCVVIGPVSSIDGARHHAEGERFDLALLDIDLGNENVFPFAESLARQHIPFAFVTGFSVHVLPVKLVAYPLIRKPFSGESLKGAVQAALNGPFGGLIPQLT